MPFRESQDRKCGRKDDRTTRRSPVTIRTVAPSPTPEQTATLHTNAYGDLRCRETWPLWTRKRASEHDHDHALEIFAVRFGSKPFELDLPELFEMF